MNLKFEKFGILYVDDEVKSLKYFREIFEDLAPIYTAENGEEGFEVFQKHRHEIGIVLSDQRMPGESGLSFLQRLRECDERPLRILVTAFADLNMAVEALNEGLLYSYLTKPWDPGELEGKLGRALENFCLRSERDELLRDKAEAFQQLMMAEKAATIGVLSSGLNHHMRNALTVIQPFFDMIPDQLREEIGGEKGPNDTSFWSDYYKDVEQQLKRITSILSNLSEGAARQGESSSGSSFEQNVDIVAVIETAAQKALAGDDSITFVLRNEDGVPSISVDTQKISRMAFLLIQEAKMNIVEEGEIEIVVSRSPADSSRQESIRIMCMDNGSPIPESSRKHLFDPFYVRADKPGEVGMNLMTCYLTVFQHGGTIKAEGLEDGRNAINIILPLEPTKPSSYQLLGHLFKDGNQESS